MRTKPLLHAWMFIVLVSVLFLTACADTNNSETTSGDNNNTINNEENDDNNDAETNNDAEANNDEETSEPEQLTLKWAHQWGEEHWDENIGVFVETQFPHIEFEVMEIGTDDPDGLVELIAAQNIPDIISITFPSHVPTLVTNELHYDLDELVEEHSYDLSRFESSLLDHIRAYDRSGERALYTLQYERGVHALHYNKDIFDLFGVSYPEDGMTWDEVLDLARDMTRVEGDTQYRGLDIDDAYPAYTQFNTTSVDVDTLEVHLLENDAYRRYFELIREITTIPGNWDFNPPSEGFGQWGANFTEDRNVAMWPHQLNLDLLSTEGDHADFNVDIASYPTWEGHEGTDPLARHISLSITSASESKNEAFDVITYLMSDEVQMTRSKQAKATVLDNPEVQAVFASDREDVQHANLDALFVNAPASGPEQYPRYDVPFSWSKPGEYMDRLDEIDINEWLRELQDEGDEIMRERLAQE